MNTRQFVFIKSLTGILRVPVIAPTLYEEAMRIEPSIDGHFEYRPCKVESITGEMVDRVYVVEAISYMLHWGFDPGRRQLSILSVAHVQESPSRLPATLANSIYKKGETSMGGTRFSIVFRDGTKAGGEVGNAVDFLDYPPGYQGKDVIDVLYDSTEGAKMFTAADYRWCLYALPPDDAAEKLRGLETHLKNTKVTWRYGDSD